MPESGDEPAREVPRTAGRAARHRRNGREHPAVGAHENKDQSARKRLHGWLASANKLVLASVGAGIAGIITAAVIAIPHALATMFHSPSPFTIVGSASPGLRPSSAAGRTLQSSAQGGGACGLAGVYVVQGNVEVHGTVTTADVAGLVVKAAFANETAGSYVLQASPGQTAVLTGIHTVLFRRLPASTVPATVVVVNSGCVGASLIQYDASIDLDAADLAPKLTRLDEATGTRTPVTDLATVVAQDQPLALNFDATTTKFDVTWQLRFDYAADGKAHSATLPSAGLSFHTDAITPGDSWLTLTLNPDGSTWSAAAATAEQKKAKDQADAQANAQAAVAYDYNSLRADQSSLKFDLPVSAPDLIGQELSAAFQDERDVLSEAASAGNSTVCADASMVAFAARAVANDAQSWASPDSGSAVGDLTDLSSTASSLSTDLLALLQVEPGFNGNADTPSPAQARQAASAAIAAVTKAAPAANAMINRVNADVAKAYAYAARAAAAGRQCTLPGPAPSPIAPVP